MQPPIFLFDEDEHDLWVFSSVEEAARFLEPWNISTARIYDRHATALKASTELKKRFWMTREVVVVHEESPRRTDEADLRPRLVEFLQLVEKTESDALSKLSLSDLVDRAAVHARS